MGSSEFSTLYSALVEQERREIHERLVEIFLLASVEKTDIALPIAIRTAKGVQVKHEMFSVVLAMSMNNSDVDYELRRAMRMTHPENEKKFLDMFKSQAARVYAECYALPMAELKVHCSISRTLGNGG